MEEVQMDILELHGVLESTIDHGHKGQYLALCDL
jgi:hypothetical protein